METLVLTTLAMESVALQNVKFWSTVYSVVCTINIVLSQSTCTWLMFHFIQSFMLRRYNW